MHCINSNNLKCLTTYNKNKQTDKQKPSTVEIKHSCLDKLNEISEFWSSLLWKTPNLTSPSEAPNLFVLFGCILNSMINTGQAIVHSSEWRPGLLLNTYVLSTLKIRENDLQVNDCFLLRTLTDWPSTAGAL